MFDYFYYGLPFFFTPILFSLILIISLGIITPYIIILANKDIDYKNKKIFIIYEKAISILLILHIVLTLINFIRIINFISNLIIGAVGIAIIYGIFYILEKNNIFITKPNIKKYLKLIGKIFIYICVFILSILGGILGGMGLWEFIKIIFINFIEFTSPFFNLYFEKTGINVESFWENISNPEYMLILLIIAFVPVCIILLLFFIFILLFLIFIISVSNNYILDKFYNEKIRKKVKNNKDNFISKIFKKWKKDKSGDNYTI